MVNYKRVVCEAAVICAFLISFGVDAAPTHVDCDKHHFDQRQNGTENYRLNIDGVVIAVAPAESLLAAASDFDLSDLLDLEDFAEFTQKPPKPQASTAAPPAPLDQPLSQSSEQPLLQASTEAGAKKEDSKGEKKELSKKKQEKAHRLKMRLANILVPLLRRNRHH